jgi:hypothetical protein
MSVARQAADSMRSLLRETEQFYDEFIPKQKPVVDSLIAIAAAARSSLSGLQLRKVDSVTKVVDSLSRIEWYLQALDTARFLVDYLPTLKEDEAKAAQLRKSIPGTWVCTNKKTSKVFKEVNAVEKKVFTFNRDGSALFVESESGRSSKSLKMSYKFTSYGTYDFAGDTIMVFVNRFKASPLVTNTRFERENGTEYWEKKVEPAYDSTITDGSQDRYILLADLKQDFVRR